MNGEDSLLKILIQLGVIGQADVKAARDLLVETGNAAKGQAGALDDLGKKTEETGNAFSQFNKHGAETRRLLAELDRITPGFGTAMRGLLMDMGPMAVAILSIEAAVTWWKFYKDEEKAATEQHAKDMEMWEEATRSALVQQWEFNKSIQEISDPLKKNQTILEQSNALLENRLKIFKELSHNAEANKEAERKTEQEKINNLKFALDQAAMLEGEHEESMADLKSRYAEAEKSKNSALMNDLTENLKPLEDKIAADKKQIEELTGKLNTSKQEQIEGFNPAVTEAVLQGQGSSQFENLRQQFLKFGGVGGSGARAFSGIWNQHENRGTSQDEVIQALVNALATLSRQKAPFPGVGGDINERENSGFAAWGRLGQPLPNPEASGFVLPRPPEPSISGPQTNDHFKLVIDAFNASAKERDDAILTALSKATEQNRITMFKVHSMASVQ
jgi:hypothetical protein